VLDEGPQMLRDITVATSFWLSMGYTTTTIVLVVW